MTALDFAPAPGAQGFPALVLSHARMESRLLARNGEQLLLALVIPILLLVGGTEASGVFRLGAGRRVDILTPGVLALAVMSASFTSLAIATCYERRYGVLKLLGATPLGRGGLLTGKVLALVVTETVQVIVLCLVGFALGWHPHGGVVAGFAIVFLLVLGTAAFAAWGMFLAGKLRAEATLAVANLVYVVLLAGGAVIIPASEYPSGMAEVASWLPSGALAEGLRQVTSGGGLDPWRVVALLAWLVVGAALTARTFRWE